MTQNTCNRTPDRAAATATTYLRIAFVVADGLSRNSR
jgi:hypothetical protein